MARALLLFLVVSCAKGGQARAPVKREAPRVETVAVKRGSVRRWREVPAVVVARERVRVSAEMVGKVVEVRVEVGQEVRKGEVLVRLDDSLLRKQWEAQKAALRALEARIRKAERGPRKEERARVEAEYRRWEKEYERAKKLYEEGALSQRELEQVETAYRRAKAMWEEVQEGTRKEDLEALYAEREARRAELALTEERLERMVLRAPMDGWVVEKRVAVGDMLAPGVPAIVMESREKEVRARIPEDWLDALDQTVPAQFEGRPVEWRWVRPARAQGLVEVRFALGGQKESGAQGNLRLPEKEQEGWLVPRSAVFQREGKWFVQVVRERKVRWVEVERGACAEMCAVRGDLREGERVLRRGMPTLGEGTEVRE